MNQLRPASSSTGGPSVRAATASTGTRPSSSRPWRTTSIGSAATSENSSMKWRRPTSFSPASPNQSRPPSSAKRPAASPWSMSPRTVSAGRSAKSGPAARSRRSASATGRPRVSSINAISCWASTWYGRGGKTTGSTKPLSQAQQPRSLEQRLFRGRQQEAVPLVRWPPPGAAHPLEEARDGRRAVDLDDAVEVADVDAELEHAGRDDDPLFRLQERLLRGVPLVERERGVCDPDGDIRRAEAPGEGFGASAAVDEAQTLLAGVEPGDHGTGVGEAADVVELHVGGGGAAAGRAEDRRGRLVRLQPRQQFLRVAHRRRETDPLRLVSGVGGDAAEHAEQVPPAIVAGEGVHLVDDDHPHAAEEGPRLGGAGDQLHLQRLGRGEQEVGRVGPHPLLVSGRHVAVPHPHPASHEPEVAFQPRREVVDERFDGADVEDREAPPIFSEHPRDGGKGGGLGLAAGGGSEHDRVVAVKELRDHLVLEGPEVAPAEAVDDVVLEQRVEAVERGGHGGMMPQVTKGCCLALSKAGLVTRPPQATEWGRLSAEAPSFVCVPGAPPGSAHRRCLVASSAGSAGGRLRRQPGCDQPGFRVRFANLLKVQFDVVQARRRRSRPLRRRQLALVDRQRVVLPRVKVGELVHAIQHVGDELF